MRTTTLTAFTLLTLTATILATPLPPQLLESHDRALSSKYRPSPHLLPINAPHTPSRPTFSHADSRSSLPESSSQSADNVSPKELSQHWSERRPSSLSTPSLPTPRAPLPHGAWLVSSARIRKPCHSTSSHSESASPPTDNHPPKELGHWSENRPSRITESGWQEVKSWGIVRWRVTSTRVVRQTVFSEEMLKYILWVLSACLIIAMGLELISLCKASPRSVSDDDEESSCGCGDENGSRNEKEKSVSFEKEKLISKQNPAWHDDDEDKDVDIDLDENGLERSSW